MLTRCPICNTTFRVTPDQLKVRLGRVRCGQCLAEFNALETLVDEAVAPSATVPLPGLPIPDEPAEPGGIWNTVRDPLHEPQSEAEPDSQPEFQPELLPEFRLVTPKIEAVPSFATFELAVEPTEAPERNADPVVPIAAEAVPESAAVSKPLPRPIPPDAEPDPYPDEPFLHEDVAPRRWPWVLGSLLALLVLTIQAALHFRVELASKAPRTRPALVAACEILGCQLSLPMEIAQIGIESSDLHPDTQGAGHLQLVATLRNRAPYAQAWPHLELTLTDSGDRALIRRAIAPADYLPAKLKPEDGFRAKSEQPVQLDLQAPGVPAVGYRLYVFYP